MPVTTRMECSSRSRPSQILEAEREKVNPTLAPCAPKETNRRMRTHRKSRHGCRNCKLRKVKCDESKPGCRKCESYGTFCNYEAQFSDLQSSADGASTVGILQRTPCSETQTILSNINVTPKLTSTGLGSSLNNEYEFRPHDLVLVHRFHTRTILTLGAAKHMHIYQDAFTKLTFSHPFLLHVVLTLTMMHDRYLGIEATHEQSTAIAFHWSQGAALLNSKLSVSINPSERDALWACAGLLGALSFASFQARTPEEAWPLKATSPSDLDWLRMSTGKKEIWKIADPLRADSIFYPIAPDFLPYSFSLASPGRELEALPPELIRLCKINATSTQENNPYLASVTVMAQLINLECSTHNVGEFMCFFGCMHTDYKSLLAEKDPRALLLLAYWYAKMCQYKQWWICQRALLECQAICIYMKGHHGGDNNILKLMQHAKSVCGLV